MDDRDKRALVIFPTYNEKDNIEEIVSATLDMDDRIHILIVDDNSPDGTGPIADNLVSQNDRINVEHRPGKAGLGKAYLHGFKWAIENKYDYIFEMDADFSHSPEFLPDFLEAIKDNDLVLGSRYISGVNVINWPMSRLLLSYFANKYAGFVTGLKIKDATGGFKCFRREVLEAINLDEVKSNGYTFQIEMTMRAAIRKFRIKEIPIIFYERQAGASKMSKKIVREAIWMVWWLRLARIFGKL
ncbi:MAG: polyprenol monophosphomannose synthase [candidate division Zixibacteria bacterium]